jgi:hypothetical protein
MMQMTVMLNDTAGVKRSKSPRAERKELSPTHALQFFHASSRTWRNGED